MFVRLKTYYSDYHGCERLKIDHNYLKNVTFENYKTNQRYNLQKKLENLKNRIKEIESENENSENKTLKKEYIDELFHPRALDKIRKYYDCIDLTKIITIFDLKKIYVDYWLHIYNQKSKNYYKRKERDILNGTHICLGYDMYRARYDLDKDIIADEKVKEKERNKVLRTKYYKLFHAEIKRRLNKFRLKELIKSFR